MDERLLQNTSAIKPHYEEKIQKKYWGYSNTMLYMFFAGSWAMFSYAIIIGVGQFYQHWLINTFAIVLGYFFARALDGILRDRCIYNLEKSADKKVLTTKNSVLVIVCLSIVSLFLNVGVSYFLDYVTDQLVDVEKYASIIENNESNTNKRLDLLANTLEKSEQSQEQRIKGAEKWGQAKVKEAQRKGNNSIWIKDWKTSRAWFEGFALEHPKSSRAVYVNGVLEAERLRDSAILAEQNIVIQATKGIESTILASATDTTKNAYTSLLKNEVEKVSEFNTVKAWCIFTIQIIALLIFHFNYWSLVYSRNDVGVRYDIPQSVTTYYLDKFWAGSWVWATSYLASSAEWLNEVLIERDIEILRLRAENATLSEKKKPHLLKIAQGDKYMQDLNQLTAQEIKDIEESQSSVSSEEPHESGEPNKPETYRTNYEVYYIKNIAHIDYLNKPRHLDWFKDNRRTYATKKRNSKSATVRKNSSAIIAIFDYCIYALETAIVTNHNENVPGVSHSVSESPQT